MRGLSSRAKKTGSLGVNMHYVRPGHENMQHGEERVHKSFQSNHADGRQPDDFHAFVEFDIAPDVKRSCINGDVMSVSSQPGIEFFAMVFDATPGGRNSAKSGNRNSGHPLLFTIYREIQSAIMHQLVCQQMPNRILGLDPCTKTSRTTPRLAKSYNL